MRRLLLVAAALAAGCATSSAANYSVTYHAAGAATDTQELHRKAERSFHADVTTDERRRAIAAIEVYLDAVPRELSVTGTVVDVAPGIDAALLASVDIAALWKTPDDDAEVIPALQKAADAVGANIAFCPRGEKSAAHAWRCYLVQSPRR